MALCGTTLKSPQAAFLKVLPEVRMLLSSKHDLLGASFGDTCEVEAIGLLVILATWSGLLAGSLWPLHRQCGG